MHACLNLWLSCMRLPRERLTSIRRSIPGRLIPPSSAQLANMLNRLGGVFGSGILSAASDSIGRKITLCICNALVSLSIITLLLAKTQQ